ncbi:MAG: carboxypeptidase M32 [Lachnospiraceae bacterium]|nr:carboxypeptidase M32 [Lachnospiraceae bacterium]
MSEILKEFKEYLEKLSHYNHAVTQMQWDMQTQTPSKGYAYKVDTMTYFSTEAFLLETAKEYGELLVWLSQPEELKKLDEGMQVTVKRRLKEFEENKRIPKEFYEEMVRAQAHSQKAWEEAKRKDDYNIFCPHLQKMIDYTKELVSYTKPDMDVYDALLDMYEEGMDSETVDKLFEELKEGLVPLLQKIEKQPAPDSSLFDGEYPIHKQKELGAFLLDYIGYDMEAGAMSESEHPFTMGFGPKDVRVTNHYSKENAINAMFSIIHEGGHGIFEQGVDERYEKTDIVTINFLGLHESQSRFFENILGRNMNFWKPIYEKVGEFLPKFQEVDLEKFYQEINHVRPGFIRTDADELTYSLHVILRYELEKAIFREGVSAEELPQLWNDKMEELLGVRPTKDSEGILQDIHWSDGSFGYFPTYALGNIYDGMFLEKITEELGDVDKILAEGRIKEITAWLHEKIHRYGSLRTSKEVIQLVCGKEITADPILRYFDEKYSRLYDLV